MIFTKWNGEQGVAQDFLWDFISERGSSPLMARADFTKEGLFKFSNEQSELITDLRSALIAFLLDQK